MLHVHHFLIQIHPSRPRSLNFPSYRRSYHSETRLREDNKLDIHSIFQSQASSSCLFRPNICCIITTLLVFRQTQIPGYPIVKNDSQQRPPQRTNESTSRNLLAPGVCLCQKENVSGIFLLPNLEQNAVNLLFCRHPKIDNIHDPHRMYELKVGFW